MRKIILALMFPLLLTPAQAENPPTVREFLSGDGGQEAEIAAKTYISGVIAGYQIANVMMKQSGFPQLFCPPDNWSLGSDQYVNFIQSSVRRRPKLLESSLAIALLSEFQLKFPCRP
jgi:hypothetical protein